jgi:hypothetical protein
MRQARLCLLLGILALVVGPHSNASAQMDEIVHASLHSVEDCGKETQNQIIRSGCVQLPPARESLGKAGKVWLLPPKKIEDKIWPKTPGQSTERIVPVYKAPADRTPVAPKECRNCRFVSVATPYGKQLLEQQRKFERQIGVQIPQAIVGFFVPFPFNIPVGTLVCSVVNVQFDAREYRQDFKEEPTGEQYGKSFTTHLGYCSGIRQLLEARTFPQFLLAGLNLVAPWVNLPQGVTYAQQGLYLSQWANGNRVGPTSAGGRQVVYRSGPSVQHMTEAR